jgi:hypothetical protein
MQSPGAQPLIVGGIVAVLGLAVAFWGYRMLHTMVRVFGTLLGMMAAPALGLKLGLSHMDQSWAVGLIALAGGILGFFVARPCYFALQFVSAGLVGFLAGETAAAAVPQAPAWLGWALPLGLGALTGLLALRFERPLNILATSFGGAAAATAGALMMLSTSGDCCGCGWIPTAAAVGLGAIGTFAQFKQKRTKLLEHGAQEV